MSTIEVLLPRPAAAATAWSGAANRLSVAGERVAIVNNGWQSSDDFAPVLERVLRAEYGVADVVHFRNKGTSAEMNAGTITPDDVSRGGSVGFIREVSQSAPVVLTMLGN
jgi:hypothetical protein